MDSRSPLGSRQLLNLEGLSTATASGRLASNGPGSSSLLPARRWYCAQAIPGQTLLAFNGIVDQRINCFVPLYRGRTDQIELMFGTYFFVGFDLQLDIWEHIVHTPGVLQLLSISPTTPCPLPIGAVEDLIERMGPDGVVGGVKAKPQPRTKFNAADLVGKQLRVTSGPFASFYCIAVESLNDRVKVLLDIFGRTSSVELSVSQVELSSE